jgi:hypothetical protein
VLGNCGTIVSFRVGADDAPVISRHIDAPEHALKELGTGEAYARAVVGGQPWRALRMKTEKVRLQTDRLAGHIRQTRAAHAWERALVERMLKGSARRKGRRW